MPIFTAEEVTHPNPAIGRCFAIDVLLPRLDEPAWVVQGYIEQGFQLCVVSRELAERLDFVTTEDEAKGAVVLQTRYEGSPTLHRSVPVPLVFRLANPKAGPAYIHFALSDLAPFLNAERLDAPHPRQRPFLAFHPVANPESFCFEIPIERPGSVDLDSDPS